MNKNREINDIYLDGEVPLNYLETINEGHFRTAYQKFTTDQQQKYSIEPRIIELEKQAEAEFREKKLAQARISEKIEEERDLQRKFNEIFPKKSHVTPPSHLIRSPQKRTEIMEKNDDNISKSTQTAHEQGITKVLFSPQKDSPDFNLKTVQNGNKNRLCKAKLCKDCEEKVGSYSYYRPGNKEKSPIKFGNQLNEVLLEAKSLIARQKFQEAEKILENLIRRNVNHADVFYLMGETKRHLGYFH